MVDLPGFVVGGSSDGLGSTGSVAGCGERGDVLLGGRVVSEGPADVISDGGCVEGVIGTVMIVVSLGSMIIMLVVVGVAMVVAFKSTSVSPKSSLSPFSKAIGLLVVVEGKSLGL